MQKHYDHIIVGAGICGASLAFFLHQAGKRVLVIEKEKIAAGGSGAAGAFIAPKFTRDPLQLKLSQNAHTFALDFFNTHFPEYIQNRGLLHLASSEADAKKIAFYRKDHHTTATPEPLKNVLKTEALAYEHIYIESSAMVDASGVCKAMLDGINVVYASVKEVMYEVEKWWVEGYSSDAITLATGAYKDIINEPYIEVTGVWGHRINVKTPLKNSYNIHQKVSISPQQEAGYLAIGATHNRDYHPEITNEAYDYKVGRKTLLEKASFSVDLGDVEVLEDFAGLRASYYDHIPVVGALIKAQESVDLQAKIKNGVTVNEDLLIYYPHLSVINGVGGYGFSQAPYLASMLAEALISGKKIKQEYQALRLFKRWVKRNN